MVNVTPAYVEFDSPSGSGTITLINLNAQAKNFQVQTKRPRAFVVHPSRGVVPPDTSLRISIKVVNDQSANATLDMFLISFDNGEKIRLPIKISAPAASSSPSSSSSSITAATTASAVAPSASTQPSVSSAGFSSSTPGKTDLAASARGPLQTAPSAPVTPAATPFPSSAHPLSAVGPGSVIASSSSALLMLGSSLRSVATSSSWISPFVLGLIIIFLFKIESPYVGYLLGSLFVYLFMLQH
eukprot:ANDGO_00652.mRNA.1 hypothetical protein